MFMDNTYLRVILIPRTSIAFPGTDDQRSKNYSFFRKRNQQFLFVPITINAKPHRTYNISYYL